MKPLFLILSLSIFIAGCSREQPANSTLLEAEQNVYMYPQKTLEMVYAADTTQFNQADSALYDLLVAEAAQKMGVVIGDQQLLRRSCQFFERHGTNERLMRALLQLSIVQYEHQQMAEAIVNIKRAEQLVEHRDNYALRHEVYSTLGRINTDGNDLKRALHYYRLALSAARNVDNTNWQALDMAQLANIYGLMGDTLRQNSYIAQCQPLLKRTANHERAVVLTSLAGMNMRLGYILTAQQQLEEAYQLEPLQETCLLLGNLCSQRGDWSTATDYWYMALNGLSNRIKADAYRQLIGHFGRNCDYERVCDLSKRLIELYASMEKRSAPSDLTQLQNQYDDDMKNRRFWRTATGLLAAVLSLFIVVTLLLLYHRRRVRHYNQIIDELNNNYAADLARYRELQHEMLVLQHEKQTDALRISQKQEEITALEQKLSEYQDDKQQPAQWNVENQLLNAEPVYHLHTLAAKGRNATAADWQEVYELMGDFMSKLSRYSLSARELSVCALIKLRFIPSEIAALTNSSPQAVTNLRVRLHDKIFGEKGGARDFDRKIRML